MLFKDIQKLGKYTLKYRYGNPLFAEGEDWQNALIEVIKIEISRFRIKYEKTNSEIGEIDFHRDQDVWEMIPIETDWDG